MTTFWLSLRPVWIFGGTHRRVGRQFAFCVVRRDFFPAQLLHAGTYGRKVVGSTRSVHVSSHPLD
jgi:hypothetical protein